MKHFMILLIAGLLVIGSSINAQPGNGMKGKAENSFGIHNDKNGFDEFPGSSFERMQKNLDLTDDQSEKISALRFEHQNMVIDLKSEIQKNRLIVRKMMEENKVDKDKLLQITSKNNELRGKILLSKTSMWLDVYNILDDTQKVKWTKTFAKLSSRDREHRNLDGECGKTPRHRMR